MRKISTRGRFLFAIMASLLVISVSISFVMSYLFSEIKAREEKLIVKICTDRPPIGVEPLTLNFSVKVMNAKGRLKYEWDFGNGERSKDAWAKTTYKRHGIYNCTLLVSDETGRQAKDSIKVIVERNRPPIVTLNINKKTVERKFTLLSVLALLPIPFWPYKWAGNQQMFLDRIERKKGTWAWGESGIVITAQVNDPEGDEIISYRWREQTADKLVTISGKTLLPVHNLIGNETVKTPALYAWIEGRHIVTLTVEDSAGNVVSVTTDYIVSKNWQEIQIKMGVMALSFLIPFVPRIMDTIKEKLPTPKAEISLSGSPTFNFSAYIDEKDTVKENVTLCGSFVIENIDKRRAAREIYISLDKPFSLEKGLPEELEKEGIVVELSVYPFSMELFSNGIYTKWRKSMKIEELPVGGKVRCNLSIRLEKGLVLKRGEYLCNLYIYQEKTIRLGKIVDVFTFKVIM